MTSFDTEKNEQRKERAQQNWNDNKAAPRKTAKR